MAAPSRPRLWKQYVDDTCCILSERIRRDFNIRAVFKSGPTLRSLLTRVKDLLPMEKQANVVYEVPCTCGKAYISETTRRLETRLKEHIRTRASKASQKSLPEPNMPGRRTIPSAGMTLGYCSMLAEPWS